MVEGEVENNSFGDRGNCKCPPYTIQTEAGLSEDHGMWDSGTGEDNADDTAKLCHTKTGKCADGHKLNGHKGFAESDDDQIVDRNRQNIFFVEEKGSNRSWQEYESTGYNESPDSEDFK